MHLGAACLLVHAHACAWSVMPLFSPTSLKPWHSIPQNQVETVVGVSRGRESNEPEAYMPRNRALVDLLLDRQQDILCLQVRRTALPATLCRACLSDWFASSPVSMLGDPAYSGA